jgi:hypothetical protein
MVLYMFVLWNVEPVDEGKGLKGGEGGTVLSFPNYKDAGSPFFVGK